MLTPEAAWEAIAEHVEPLAPEETPRSAAAGRVLAAAVAATVDVPFADVSAMDGYVTRGDVEPGAALPVRATVTAGRPPEIELRTGEAAKIMTGAVVPRGGDRVIPVEETDGGGDRVVIHRPPSPGAHIRRHGEVVEAGDRLLGRGTLLTPGGVSLLASHGYRAVPTHRRPAVSVLTTGDELVVPEAEPAPGQLRDSNTSFLLAAGRSLGLEFRSLGIARDRLDVLRSRIREGLRADVLLLCGGVSMGELDLVEGVLEELGCVQLFDRVKIQPGKPLVAARHTPPGGPGGTTTAPPGGPGGTTAAPPGGPGGTTTAPDGSAGWVLGLPGNPASVMATFWLFARPLLRRLQGLADGFWHGALAAELTAPLPPGKDRDRFLPAAVAFDRGRILATPFPPRGSHDVGAYGRGTALVRIRPRAPRAAAGERCEILPLADWPADGSPAGG